MSNLLNADVHAALNREALSTLEVLRESGFDSATITSIEPILGLGIADTYTARELFEEKKIDRLECEFRVRFVARQLEAVINHRATPDTLAIMNATPEQCAEWSVFYFDKSREMFLELNEIELTKPDCKKLDEWRELDIKLDEYAWYFWQCERKQLTESNASRELHESLGVS